MTVLKKEEMGQKDFSTMRKLVNLLQLKWGLSFVLLSLFPSLVLSQESNKKPHPNIIIVMVDTLRADYLGCYGFDGTISPRIDQLSLEGVTFEHGFSPAPWTKPSVASFFTSLYPQTHGITQMDKKHSSLLADEAFTMAEFLKKEGFQTGAFVGNSWLRDQDGFAQGFDAYTVWDDRNQSALDVFKPARNWLASLNPTKPFFLYLHFMDVHGPYQCSRGISPSINNSRTLAPNKKLSQKNLSEMKPYLKETSAQWEKEEKWELRNWRACYAEGVRKFDAHFRRVMDYLKGNEHLKNTLLIFTSDHGEELFEHGGWDHGSNLFNHQLHVPLIIQFPQSKFKGKRIAAPVSLMDILPTLIKIVAPDNSIPVSMVGKPLMPLIKDNQQHSWEELYFEAVKKNRDLYSMQTHKHKIIFNKKKESAKLFSISNDPLEQEDLAGTHPGLTRKLKRKILKHIKTLKKKKKFRNKNRAIDPELQEKLKSLGYLQ